MAHDMGSMENIILELRAALKSTLAQCLAWQGEPNQYSCTVHTAIVEEARFALDLSEDFE